MAKFYHENGGADIIFLGIGKKRYYNIEESASGGERYEETVEAFAEVRHDHRNLYAHVSCDRTGFWKSTDRTGKEENAEIKRKLQGKEDLRAV